ncbi:MAG: SDR family oxidoreductase [Labilibaculum sp.]|nr:SDR family oxidoreductase [Labilibaculum sp.]
MYSYATTKCVIRGMVKVWTTELKSRRIRVNVVSPGAIPTEA